MVQKPSESVIQFGDNIRLIGQKVFAEHTDANDLVIESFCGGLCDTNLASKMLQKGYKSLSEAIKYAASRKEATNIRNTLIEQRSGRGMSSKDISVLPAEVTAPEPPPHNTQGTGNQPLDRGTFRCYGCNAVGHYKRDCPNRLPQDDVCHYCKKHGHWKRDCFKWLNANTPTRGSVENSRYKRGQYNTGGSYNSRGGGTSYSNRGARGGMPSTRGSFRGQPNFRLGPGTPTTDNRGGRTGSVRFIPTSTLSDRGH